MEEKDKAKQILMQKLKNMKIKSEMPMNTGIRSIQRNSDPVPIKNPNHIPPDRNMFYKSQSKMQGQDQMRGHYHQKNPQQENANKNDPDEKAKQEPRKVMKTRKPYYQHYSKQGVYEPALEYIKNHPNPSGKPPDIPDSFYTGIQVVAKRPWVYFGPENIPPSDSQDINEKNFSIIFQKAKKDKKQHSGILKKSSSKKKGKYKHDDEISEISDQFTSNFTFTDSVDLSKESDLISEFRSQTRTNRNTESSQVQSESQVDDFSSVAGSVTQRQRYNLFDSSDSDQAESQVVEVKKKKKKIMFDSSDSDGEKMSVQPSSIQQGSRFSENTMKVVIDEDESDMNTIKDKNRGKLRQKQKKAGNKSEPKGKNRISLGENSDDSL